MGLKTEYKAGPLTINLRILLEPKGFLRLVMVVIAILAFATTAGFNSTSQGNNIQCTGSDNGTAVNYTTYFTFRYPYTQSDYRFQTVPTAPNTMECGQVALVTLPLSGSAQFFVAMGVLSLIYVLGATLVYILFITPELFMAKWLVLGDFFCTVVFGVLYTLAAISWSAGSNQLEAYAGQRLRAYGRDCLGCDVSVASTAVRTQTFSQAIISLLFGWLAAFLWFASVWFVYKDTYWHKDATGPLAKLYEVTGTKKSQEDGGESSEQKSSTGDDDQ